MSRILRSVLAALAILTVVAAAYVVLTPDEDGVVPSSQDVLEFTPETTPRGLAVAIIDHLGDRTITSVAVTGKGGTHAVVETTDPEVASVSVSVRTSTEGPYQCGSDDGYTRVSCSANGPLREVVRRTPGGAAPTVIGHANDDFRGDVLIEVHGDSDTPEVVELVQSLVDDEDLGEVTSQDRNDRGRDLDVVPLRFESTLESVG
ncbi:hypothetical protein [Nocardioides plantarum]|uniref:Uncharacterized protein n=1 Tax=Nocardioides plantarum TaxID=29299 RepID=A0ABV5KC79_9ACTN|nr:hypothetical protein [Nocardioides plantarum]